MPNILLSKREFFLKIFWIKKMLLILQCGGCTSNGACRSFFIYRL